MINLVINGVAITLSDFQWGNLVTGNWLRLTNEQREAIWGAAETQHTKRDLARAVELLKSDE